MNRKIMLFLALVLICSAPAFSIDPIKLNLECENDHCVPNRPTEWQLNISNIGTAPIKVLGYRIQDAVTGQDIVYRESERAIEIISPSSHIFTARENLPYPNQNDFLILHVCTIIEPDTDSWGKAGKRVEYCYRNLNLTFNITECLADYDCAEDSICTEERCTPLNCSYCQYTKLHECHSYECCKEDECKINEACTNHVCRELKCMEEEYIVNHTCTKTICRFDEGIVNFTCVPLNCSYDEHIKNHDCVKLNCSYDEYALNHSCMRLNCSYDEYPYYHECVKADCSYDEIAFNHTCVGLDCNFLQKPEEHECRINGRIMLYAFLSLIIIFLIVLNIEKYLYIKKKHFVELFLKILKVKKGENIKTGDTKQETANQKKDKNGKS